MYWVTLLLWVFPCCGVFLTGCGCMGRRSRTPPPLGAPPEAGWHRTRTGCASRCGTLCECTAPSPRARPRRACFPGSLRRCPPHSSPLGSSSAGTHNRKWWGGAGVWELLRFINHIKVLNSIAFYYFIWCADVGFQKSYHRFNPPPCS